MTDQLFGPIEDFHDAEMAVQAHIKKWIDMYLAGRERKKGITPGAISRPKSYFTAQTFTTLPGYDRTPAIVTVSPGAVEAPRRHGDGTHDLVLRMAVAACAYSSEVMASRALAGHYQAALLSLLLNQKKIENTAARVLSWRDLRMEDVPTDDLRNFAVARLEFQIRFPDFGQEVGGFEEVPPDPDQLPPQPDRPEVHTVQTILEAS